MKVFRPAGAETSRPPAFLTWAALLLLGLLGAVFFGRFTPVWTLLRAALPPAVGAAAVLLASLAAGGAARRVSAAAFSRVGGLPLAPEAEPRLADTALMGVPCYGLLVAALALLPLPLGPSVILLTLALDLAALLAYGRALLRRLAGLPGACERSGPAQILAFGPPLAVALAFALTPVNSPDELVYKLAVPKAYLLAGGMVELPLNSNSYFPMALSMAGLGALAVAGGVAAKLVHVALFLSSLGVIHRLARRLCPAGALLTTAALAWTPALLVTAGWAWTEWAMIGLLLLSFEAWWGFRESPDAGAGGVMALALACALLTKYTALPWLLAFAVLFSWGLRKAPNRARTFSAALLVGIVFGGFYFFRNLAWTGSPVAPFFLSDAPQVTNYRSALGGLSELARGWDILHPGIIDDSLGAVLPLLVLMAPFALAASAPMARCLLFLGAGQLALLLAAAPSSRLMSLALVPLALPGGALLSQVLDSARPLLRRVLAGALGAAFAGQILLVGYVMVSAYDFFPVLTGAESHGRYLERVRPFMRPYGWVSVNTPPGSAVLLLGENRPYYLDRPAHSAGNLDGPRVARYLGRYPTAEALWRGLRRDGVTHVLVHRPWIRTEGDGSPPPSMTEKEYLLVLPAATARVLEECLDRCAVARDDDSRYAVYELRPAQAPETPVLES